MITTESKRIANRAATAKRTASSLRSLAEAADLDIADRGVLLTAARIIDTLASKKSREAKTKKAAEEKFERDRQAATPDATKLVNALPQTTTRERVALVFLTGYHCGYLQQCINGGETPDRLRRVLKAEVDNAIQEEISSLSYKAAKEGKPVNFYQDDLTSWFSRAYESHQVVRIAQRFDAATATADATP